MAGVAAKVSSVSGLLQDLRSGQISIREGIERCRGRIAAREPEVKAWQALDWTAVGARVEVLEASAAEDVPLRGVPIGVKDLYDTQDFPTSYGTEIYAGYRPPLDAAVVARLRTTGALVLGKTVTTELAYWKPGRTRNPLNLLHTPGGSSSGSAAAVADGMVPSALGSQTAASVIRPAAYCGVVGFKPTAGMISLAGVKAFAMSLDTAGVITTTVADAALIGGVMAARPDWSVQAPASVRPPQIAVVRGPEWDCVEFYVLEDFDQTLQALREEGAEIRERPITEAFTALADAQGIIMAVEAAREYAFEFSAHGDVLSRELLNLFEEGRRTTVERYEEAVNLRATALAALERLFDGADLLAAPSATGEAPRFEDGTGDPIMSRAWTLLGLPSITVPAGAGPLGLPLGLQLASPPRSDRQLLQAAAWVETMLSRGRKAPTSLASSRAKVFASSSSRSA